jgi:glutamine synthetase
MLPEISKDESDRNRTSPFAFTGNKFEFRAVGSSQSIAWPNTVLNTIVADSLQFVCEAIEAELKKGTESKKAVQAVVKKVLTENERILFNGDNYSAAWHAEAEKRGLPNFKDTVESLPTLVTQESKTLFKNQGVLKEDELESRYNVMLESYCKTVNIESLLTAEIAATMIFPAAIEFQHRLASTIVQTKAAVGTVHMSGEEGMLRDLCNKINRLHNAIEVLNSLTTGSKDDEEGHSDAYAHARHYQERVIPTMTEVRAAADDLEAMVDDALWPLPKFREMLYIY